MTMEISQLSFVLLAVYSFCFGIALGVVYDALRVTRIVLGAERNDAAQQKRRGDLRRAILPLIKRAAYPEKTNRVTKWLLNTYIAVGDILFVSVCGMLSVMIAYAYNNGKVRAIIFVGLVIGFLLYYNTVGRLVMKVSELIAFAIRCVVVYVIEGVRFLARKMKKMIKIKKKGAKKDAKRSKESKKTVVR